jgi:D-alanine-D-alanine ligase
MRMHNFGVLMAAPAGGEAARGALTGGDDSQLDGQSGQDLVSALTRLGHRATPVLFPDDDPVRTLRAAGITACVLATHGSLGGSGAIQGLLDLGGIPHTGPSAAATALAFDKLRARQILGCHSLPVPTSLALDPALDARGLALLGWPAVLKPRRGSLGAGVRFLDDPAAVTAATGDRTGEWLVERAVAGREIQVVVLDGVVLGAMEVEHTDPGQICAMTCPPALTRSRRHGIDHLATRAAAALGLTRGPVRVDILLHERHNEVILEVEPLPPLHRAGVVAKVALAAGLQYDALVARMIGEPAPARAPARSSVVVTATRPMSVAEVHAQ